jgi:integrase
LHRPEDAAVIQRVLAIPPKRFDRTLVTYLTEDEITALLAAPDRGTWTGRRDHALLMLACQTGLRASELIQLTVGDVHLGAGAHVSCMGKGRKQRITPLTTATATTLRTWRDEHARQPTDPLFPTRRGTHSAATDYNADSPPTPPPPHAPARVCTASGSHPTCCATPPQCDCWPPALTPA